MENDTIAIAARDLFLVARMPTVLLVLLAVFLAACTDDFTAAPTAEGAARSSARAPSAPAGSSDAGPSGPPRIHDVAGLVLDAWGTPVVGRPVVVVDARGDRRELMTDEGGTFHAMEIAPPYDVGLEAAPSGPLRVPVTYFGLRREAPRFALPERPVDVAPPHAFRIVVDATCAAPPCTVTVATSSAHGSGAGVRALNAASGTVVVPVEHAFRVWRVRDTESMEVDVLVTDASGSAFAYGHAAGIATQPAERSDVEIVPAPIASAGPLAIDGVGASGTALHLALPSGATMALARASGAALVVHAPLVPGATLDAEAWSGGAVAWSGSLDPRTSYVRLEPPRGPVITQPSPGGTLSRRGSGMAWADAAGAITISLTDLATGQPDLLVHTMGAGLSLRRLDRLGVAAPALGAHELVVTAYAGIGVDDLAGLDAVTARAGGRVEQRMRVDVIP